MLKKKILKEELIIDIRNSDINTASYFEYEDLQILISQLFKINLQIININEH